MWATSPKHPGIGPQRGCLMTRLAVDWGMIKNIMTLGRHLHSYYDVHFPFGKDQGSSRYVMEEEPIVKNEEEAMIVMSVGRFTYTCMHTCMLTCMLACVLT